MASCNGDAGMDFQGGTFNSAELGIIHCDASQLEKNFTSINQTTNLCGKTGLCAKVVYEANMREKRKRKNSTLFTLLNCALEALILALKDYKLSRWYFCN
jgi:hypothetical protein